MISYCPAARCPLGPSSLDAAPPPVRTTADRKLEAIREYVRLSAADELEPSAILEIIDADHLLG